MKITVFHCGPAANESELKAIQHLKSRLQSEAGDESWVLLANLAFSVTHQLQSDEIDLVMIGPTGVRVIEVKHWADAARANTEDEANRVTTKAKKIGTTLRRVVPMLPRVDGVILLTQDPSKVKRLAGQQVRGVRFHALNDWKAAIGFDAERILSAHQVAQLASILQPRSTVAIDGSLRRMAGYVNLELQTPKEQAFHRIYRANHPARRDRVLLHVYDLSASGDQDPGTKAKREFEALHRLQLYSWAPRILDSYQNAPGYDGEMSFFTVVDPAAPCIEERATDATWSSNSRIAFARDAVRALAQLHGAGTANDPIIHRNLNPRTILVNYDNSPIFTGFEFTKIPAEISVTTGGAFIGAHVAALAPEVQAHGLAAADHRSDLYSLCFCLNHLFKGRQDDFSQRATEVLVQALAADPDQRGSVHDMGVALAKLLGESPPQVSPPPARYWTEGQPISFGDHDYHIISRLGSGGVGTTFKVIEVDRSTREDLGTYVAKVTYENETGQRVLKSYNLVRSHLGRHAGLSTIFEVARQWRENEFIALMTWISGAPLSDFIGVFPLLAEEQQEPTNEALALRWLRVMCDGLDVLHRAGLIHGDVSPRNMIVCGSDLVLTDYDFAGKIGEPLQAPGTVLYCSPSHLEKQDASPSDDIYALASSFFHVIFEKEPFRYGGELDKRRALNWAGINREEYPTLTTFLDKATSPDRQIRVPNIAVALALLRTKEGTETLPLAEGAAPNEGRVSAVDSHTQRVDQSKLIEQRIGHLEYVLQSYPGSLRGNHETRGLDTHFAALTYVDGPLDDTLAQDIRDRRVSLVILCGNAGDGKTALLQHLARQLGLGTHQSSERLFEGRVAAGPLIRMNLDGSASWKGRFADEILDEFLNPFQNGAPAQDIVHLLAINDGRLLEWIDAAEVRNGGKSTPLTAALYALLQEEAATQKSHIRFINLNQRSLVGGVTPDRKEIDAAFMERLIDRLYGGERTTEIWSPCLSCSAQDRCQVFRAARVFGPDGIPALAERSLRKRARQRLFEALQAVHLRAETHITMRELRAALVYIMFGVHFCDDYHAETSTRILPYWDRAFSSNSLARQGEVLRELAQFDPALEAHPQIDRYLTSAPAAGDAKAVARYPELTLESARRRAFFEWTAEDVEQVAEGRDALDLARGQHLRLFRNLPLADQRELSRICESLCRGISRLEDLPPQALDRPGVVPLRVTPRTPTETAFWVEKPLNAFQLKVDLPVYEEGIERLHRQAFLIYRYRNGRHEEFLRLGAELFHLLLELADGYQLGDISTDDTFANLSIFVQRLVREDEQELLAWNPMRDDAVYKVHAAIRETQSGSQQRMIITPVAGA